MGKINIWLLVFAFASGLKCHSQLILSVGEHTDYRIIMPANALPDELKAADIFQNHFRMVTGIMLPFSGDNVQPSDYEIVIGKSLRQQQFKTAKHFLNLGEDGFIILTDQNRLFISGESPKGTLNGVYAFFEKYANCRFYHPGVQHFPGLGRFEIPKINDRQVPFFTYREMYFPGRSDDVYLEWHALHSHHSGQWGMWVHTFDDLIPPDDYFSTHPEFFSEISGTRIPNGQLCLTQPEVFDVLVRNLEKMMVENPTAIYWSVSQNDNYLACQCKNCRDASARLGGESGIMIDFVNRVAARFPDKVISTLAYQYTRSAPTSVKPLPNVNIMLCSIECNRSKPIATDPSSASFVKDIQDWTRLTDNILIWDYVVQFRNYISPFPNLRVLQPNLKFFADQGCRLMFQQGSGNSLSEFVEMRSYMIAKLLWDPKQDAEAIMDDFLAGYYGAAAPYLKEYIVLLHDELKVSDGTLWIYGYPFSGINSFLKPGLLPEYEKLFDQAEKVVADDQELLDRVQAARLPLEFAILDISLHSVNEQLSWFEEKEGSWQVKEEMMNRLDTFVARCDRLGINALNEMGFSPEKYGQQIQHYILKSSERHLGVNKPVSLLTDFSTKYNAGGAAALTDGLRGVDDYHFNWLGFEGNDLEAVIDLGSEMAIREVAADFLQDIQSWVFLPTAFSVEYSIDGNRYQGLGKDLNTTPSDKAGSFVQTFTVPAGNITARYVKVRAESLGACPPWHIGAGEKSWIFTDEIVIR